MAIIFHVTTLAQWEQAQHDGEYRSPGFEQEQFLHCCTPGQLEGVLHRYFTPPPEGLILLLIDEARVLPEIRYEGDTGPFPHIYGPLNLEAVLEFQPAISGLA